MLSHLKTLFGPLLVIFLAQAMSYLLNIALAQVVDTSTYGVVAYGLTFATLISALINLGGTGNARRFLTTFLKKKDNTNTERFVTWHVNRIRIPLMISVAISVIIFFVIDPLDYYFFDELNQNIHLVGVICVLAPLYASLGVVSSYLLCDNKVIMSQFISSIVYNFLFLVIILLYIMLEYSFQKGVLPVALHIIMLQALTLAIGVILLRAFCPRIFGYLHEAKKKKRVSDKEWNQSATAMYIMSILLTVSGKIDFLMVGFLISNSKSLAYYFAAQKTGAFLMMFPMAYFIAITNDISNAIKTPKYMPAFLEKWRICTLVNIVCIGGLSAFLWLYQDFIPLMFGSTYNEAYSILCIMLVGTVCKTAISLPYSKLLAYGGYAHIVSRIMVARIALFLITMACLSPSYGVFGIAAAYSLAELLRAIMMVGLNFKYTTVRPLFIF